MQKILYAFIVCLILSLWGPGLKGQEAVLSSGNNITGANGSLSYSVGQTGVLTNSGTDGTITEGVQQPFEVLFFIGIEKKEITLESSIFPNPVSGSLTLKIESPGFPNFSYRLTDLQGSLLLDLPVIDRETSIPMGNMVPSTYLLTISENNVTVTIYKVIKK